MCPSIVIINYSVICLKHCAFFLHAHRHKQHKAAMVKTTRAKAQPQSQKRRTAVAVARQKPRGFKGWKVCENLLRQSMERIRKGSFQLMHVLACSELMHGVDAEVNWFIGGNSYVTLPTAVAEKRPGVYLAKAKFIRTKDIPEDEQGPQTAIASITCLRWLGSRNAFMKMATSPKCIEKVGKSKHDRLMEMLNYDCDPGEEE